MQSAKLATLGEMATAIAHETNQPLAVIKMAVANARRLILAGVVGDALLAKLARIDGQVDRVKTITDQIRRYGRPASRQQEPFGVEKALTLAIGFVAEQYRAAGIRLDIQLDLPDELRISGEQTMFEQVIVNLLINARDAIASADGDRPPPIVWVRAKVESETLLITVEDNAGGIRPDMLTKLFEPFRTTKPAGKGTGLGLSLSRSILRDMAGDIEAENVALGARFRIRLPIAIPQELGREAA
jgi:C4-dicarboxylate-specific signal transduction histidine kinase